MVLEKCRILGASPGEVMNLPENEDDFLTHAINKWRRNGSTTGTSS